MNTSKFLWAMALFATCSLQAADIKKPSSAKLHKAVYKNDMGSVKGLVFNGADVNDMAFGDRMPIHIAARHGFEGIFKFLIESGADYDAKSNDRSVYDWAKQGEHKGIMSLLYSLGKLRKYFASNKEQFWKHARIRKDIAKEHIDLFVQNLFSRYLLQRYGDAAKQIYVTCYDTGEIDVLVEDEKLDDDWVVLDLTQKDFYKIVKYLVDSKIKLQNIVISRQAKVELSETKKSIKQSIKNMWNKLWRKE
jgi:hypothetical protein